MNAKPSVSVVVPTYRRRDSLARLLRALERQTLPAQEFEVVVTVDGSEDGTLEMVEGFRAPYRLRALWQPNRGRAAACNAAIREAGGDLIVILDDDMEPSPGCLEAHRRAHGPGDRLCVVGAAPIRLDEHPRPLAVHMARKFEEHLERLARPGHRFGARDFYSGNASIRRADLLAAGLFDEDFRAYGNEDLELAVRLRRAGVELKFAPDALADQHYSKGFGALARATRAKGATAVQFAGKHPEVLPELQLAAFESHSRRWRLARNSLLRLSAVVKPTPVLLAALTRVLERIAPRRLDLLYRFLLDYYYWLGARAALRAERTSKTSSVFFFTDSDAFGGAEQALVTLVAGLDRDRWRPTLVHHPASGLEPLLEATRALGVETLAVPAMPEGLRGAARIPGFVAALRRRRPDVFHAHQTWQRSAKYALLAARLARVPVRVSTVQLYVELDREPHTSRQRALLGWSVDRFVAVSRHVGELLERDLGLPADKIEVVHNAIDPAAVRRPPDPALRAELTGAQNGQLVLVPARLDPQKGHRHLLRAAADVPGAIFALAGEGAEREPLEDLARSLGVDDRVIFLGYRSDIAALLAVSDLVVLPSLFEGLPVALLEAMAAGRPVIASRIGGVDELVEDDRNGLLVEPGDPAGLAQAIRALLADPERARRLAEAASELVERRFSAAATSARIAEIYEELDHARA